MPGLLLRKTIIRALESYKLPSDPNAVELLLMIAAHESGGFTYCKQVQGPALGIYQMEPDTFFDLEKYLKRSKWREHIPTFELPERMIFDVSFATAMARLFFLRRPEALPDCNDIEAMGVYAKAAWNTHLGKATAEDYCHAYRVYADIEDKELAYEKTL